MELNKSVQIKVLNIVSPQQFFFQTVADVKQIQSDLMAYLALHYAECKENNNYVPKIDEVIIVEKNNRFSMRRIKKIYNKSKIVVSALENGQTSWCCFQQIIPLIDKSLTERWINSILKGSIQCIVPASQVSVYFSAVSFMFFSKSVSKSGFLVQTLFLSNTCIHLTIFL